MSKPFDAVLLISFGGPSRREEIRPFLDVVLRGHPIPPERLEEVVRHYEDIGGFSPINAIVERQAQGLRAALQRAGNALPVYFGMRNWHPFLADVLARMAEDRVGRAAGFILAAHRSEASVNRYTDAVREGLAPLGERAPRIDYVGPWFEHPLFIEAAARQIEEAVEQIPPERREEAAWIFTAHSIPTAMPGVEGYQREIARSVERVCVRLGRQERQIAYQSRSGNPREPWLEPDIGVAIRTQAARGTKDILVVPIGFVADHVEVLWDLDIQARGIAESLGLHYVRAGTAGEHPAFIPMMADVVQQLLRAPG